MTRLHSWLSPACIVRKSPLAGLGVFAQAEIARGDIVAVWGGRVLTHAEAREIARRHPHFRTHPVTIGEGFCLASTSLTRFDDAERFNHSCSPNVGVKGQVVVVARRRIRVGEELCFDYGTTETGLEPFECRCGSSQCQGTIDGTAWQNPAFQRRHRGWFSWYLAEAIRRRAHSPTA